MAGEVGDAISGAGAGAAMGGALEGGGLGSAVGSGLESGIPTTGFEGMAANLGPDVAAAGLAANLEPNLDVAPDVGIQELANVDINAEPETVAPPTLEATPIEAPAAPAETTETPTSPTEATEPTTAEVAATPATPPEGGGPPPEQPVTEATAGSKTEGATEATDGKTTAEPDAKPVEAEAPAAEPATTPENAEKAGRTQALEAKVKDKTATAAELKELRGLKQDPEQHRADLEQKALDGTITDQEAEELGKLNSSEASSNLTPEQQAEKLKQDFNKLGEELQNKAANGEKITPQDLERFQKLSGQEALIDRGFSPEDAKAAMERVGGNKAGGERQARQMNELKGKIQELMALEMQILAIPKSVDKLRKQRDEAKKVADEKHKQVNSATTPEQRLQARGEEANAYMKIANINGVIIGQRNVVPILEARISDTEQYIRRKAGVTGGLQALMEFGGAKVRVAAANVRAEVGDEIDYRTGNY